MGMGRRIQMVCVYALGCVFPMQCREELALAFATTKQRVRRKPSMMVCATPWGFRWGIWWRCEWECCVVLWWE